MVKTALLQCWSLPRGTSPLKYVRPGSREGWSGESMGWAGDSDQRWRWTDRTWEGARSMVKVCMQYFWHRSELTHIFCQGLPRVRGQISLYLKETSSSQRSPSWCKVAHWVATSWCKVARWVEWAVEWKLRRYLWDGVRREQSRIALHLEINCHFI